jgi:hypothetical protein
MPNVSMVTVALSSVKMISALGEPIHIVSPLAELKCLSEKRSRELAGRLGKKPGGQRPGLPSAVSTAYCFLIRE